MAVTYNGRWYAVEPEGGGDRWSFDEEDKDLGYIENAIAAWTEWRDYVLAENR